MCIFKLKKVPANFLTCPCIPCDAAPRKAMSGLRLDLHSSGRSLPRGNRQQETWAATAGGEPVWEWTRSRRVPPLYSLRSDP